MLFVYLPAGRQVADLQISGNENMAKRGLVFVFVIIAFVISGLTVAWKFFLLKSDKPAETYVAEIKDAVGEIEKAVIDEGEKREEREKGEDKGDRWAEGEEGRLPEKIFIEVPFMSQAPYGVWDERHEEACEEASIIILKYYLNKKDLTKEIAEKEIQKMIDYEIKNYGDYKDSNAEQTVKLAKDFYGIENLKVIYDFKKEDVRKELIKGNPVIIPAAGRELGNPYYTPPGPLYHMLVLTGYSGDQIITNDPGTRRGENYHYNVDILYDAIHDFPGDKNRIGEGEKAMVVVRE